MPAHFPENSQSSRLDKIIEWYGIGVFIYLLFAIALLGTGRVELFSPKVTVSSWSISRTTFFFWLGWKALGASRSGRIELSWLKEPIAAALLIFLGVVATSLLPDFHGASDFRYLFFGAMHALMIIDVFTDQKRAELLFLLLALLPGFLTVRGLVADPGVLDLASGKRFGFPLDHANTAGYLFAMSMMLALGVIFAGNGRLRVLAIASAATQLTGLALTYSRGAWLGWLAGLTFLLVMALRSQRKSWRPVLALLLVPVLLYVFVKPLRERVLTLTSPQTDLSLNDRMRVMKGARDLGLEYPLRGIGYGRERLKQALRQSYQGTPEAASPIWHAHNVYLELFAETGILGLGAFLWLVALTFSRVVRRALRENGRDALLLSALAAAWIAFAVAGVGDVPFYHHEVRIFFFTLLGLCAVLTASTDARAAP